MLTRSAADVRERLERMKNEISAELAQAKSCKEIIKDAIKAKYPRIPDRANDELVSRLLHLDNDEILQMGKEQIRVEDLIMDIVEIIEQQLHDMDL